MIDVGDTVTVKGRGLGVVIEMDRLPGDPFWSVNIKWANGQHHRYDERLVKKVICAGREKSGDKWTIQCEVEKD